MKKLMPYATVKPDTWPPAFRRFLDARQPPVEPLARSNVAWTWRQGTFDLYATSLGHFLGWLHWSGRYRDELEVPDYVTPEIARSYVADMRKFDLSPPSIANRLDGVRAAVAAVAPGRDTRWLMSGINKLRAEPSDRRRTRQRMQHTADVVALGMDLMRGAGSKDGKMCVINRAIHFRDGLILVFAALAVPRLNPLQIMTLDKHLIQTNQGYKIVWTAMEIKTGQPYEARLGPELTALFDAYIQTYRPVLLAHCHTPKSAQKSGLWISRFGTKLVYDSVAKVIKTRTKKRFGESVFPHALRHGAATTLATERPDLVELVTPLLQHRRATSRDCYDLASGIESSTKFVGTLTERRTASPAGRRLMRRVSKSQPDDRSPNTYRGI